MLRDKIQLTMDHDFLIPAEVIYDAWLDPEAVSIWRTESLRLAGTTSQFVSFTNDPTIGGGFVSTYFRDGQTVRHWGQYVELSRPHRIVTTWLTDDVDIVDPSTITLELTPTELGCHLTVTHELDTRWLDFFDRMRMSWVHVINSLETYAFAQITSC